MRTIVVGINTMDNRQSGKNSTLSRLARWMGYAGVERYSFVNAIPDVVGPVYAARQVRMNWLADCGVTGYDRVVSLGPLPSRPLSELKVRHFVLPHPSGRNRLLNDPVFEEEMIYLLHEYVLSGTLPVRDDKTSVIGTVQGDPHFRLLTRNDRPAHRWREHRLRASLRNSA